MKHDARVLAALVGLFFITQVAGLLLLNHDIQVKISPGGEQAVIHQDTVVGERPEISGAGAFLTVLVSILIGTGIILLLIKAGRIGWWRVLFIFAVFLTISISLGVVIQPLPAYIIAITLAVLKMFRPNVIIHNFTEILIYSGIVILFAPLFELLWIAMLLIAISFYDMFAVWKSGHMIKMAKALTETKVFAGFSISYRSGKAAARKAERPSGTGNAGAEQEETHAILGGGDVAFPLLFAGVVMENLITAGGLAKELALLKVLIIPVFVTAFLAGLFVLGKRGKFYPAMPFLTAGCFAGLGILSLV